MTENPDPNSNDFIFAAARIDDNITDEPLCIYCSFQKKPHLCITSVNSGLEELLARAEEST